MDRIAGMNYVLIDGLRKFSGGPPGTTVTADWLNGIQEEMLSVIEEGGGLSPDPVDNTQLLQSINAIVLAAWQASQFNVRFVRYHYNSNLASAIAAIGAVSYTVLVIDGACVLSAHVTVPSNVTLWFLGTGCITLGAFNLIIQGSIQATPSTRCFYEDSSGKVTITGDRVVEAHVYWWYGAVQGWAAAFQDAVDAAPRVAVTGPGTYSLGGVTILLPNDDRKIVGYGMPTIDFDAGSEGFKQTNRKYIGLERLKITGERGLTINCTLALTLYINFLVDECTFVMDALKYAVHLTGASKGTVRGSYFSFGYGIYRFHTYHTEIVGCTFVSNTIGIHDLGDTNAYDLAAHVSGCAFRSCTWGIFATMTSRGSLKDSELTDVQLGVWLVGVDGYLMENCYIAANTDSIYAFRATWDDPTECYGIVLRNNRVTISNPATGNGFNLGYLHNSVIEDNYIEFYTAYGISIGHSADTMIQRNRFLGAGTESIHADVTNTKDTVILKENIVGEVIGYTGCRLKNNRGFADRAVGRAIILNGNTTVAVTHGLSVTPDTCFLTPDTLGGLGTYAGFSVTTYGGTTFTIESSRAVGENTEIFYDVFSRVNSLLG